MKKWFCNEDGCNKFLNPNRWYTYCLEHDPNKKTCVVCDKTIRSITGYCSKCLPSKVRHAIWPGDKDEKRDYLRQWSEDHPDYYKDHARQWEKDNPEKFRENRRKRNQTRRARQRESFIEVIDAPLLWCRDAGLCFLCGFPSDKENFHIGHVIPLARGGEHSYANTAVYHRYCNFYQGFRLIEELDIDAFLVLRESV